mgnify:CR=1 FL=1
MRWWKPWNIYKALEFVWVVKNQWFIISTCSFSSDSTRKKYTDAKEWCENGAKNGFKAGRLYEPKSQSFNDKVNAKLLSQTWIGITLVKQGPRKNRRQNTSKYRSDEFVYTSSRTKLEFQNWNHEFGEPHKSNCKGICSSWSWCVVSLNAGIGGELKWAMLNCNVPKSYICEFV